MIEKWKAFLGTTPKAAFNKLASWYIAAINVRGVTLVEKRAVVDTWAYKHKVDVMILSETKVNANCVMNSENYVWFFSSGVKNENRDKVEKARQNNEKITEELKQLVTEHHGTGIAIYKGYLNTIYAITPIDGRTMTSTLRNVNQFNIIAAYAPTSAAAEENKEKIYNNLAKTVKSFPKHEFTIIGGDFNAKLIELTDEEKQIFGQHFLEAPEHTHTHSNTQRSKRWTVGGDFWTLQSTIGSASVTANSQNE